MHMRREMVVNVNYKTESIDTDNGGHDTYVHRQVVLIEWRRLN